MKVYNKRYLYYYVILHVEIQTKEFSSWVDFQAWKEEEEASTYSCFVQPNGKVTEERISTERITGIQCTTKLFEAYAI